MDAMERRAKDKLDVSGQGFGLPMPSKPAVPTLPSVEEILAGQAAQEAQDAGETTEGTTPDVIPAPESGTGE
jgi:hypothetical protein